MMILQCPHCKAPSRVEASSAGKAARCPGCGRLFRVPAPSVAAEPPRPEPPTPPPVPLRLELDDPLPPKQQQQEEYADFEVVEDSPQPAPRAGGPEEEPLVAVELADADAEDGGIFRVVEEPEDRTARPRRGRAKRAARDVAEEDLALSPAPSPAEEDEADDEDEPLGRPRKGWNPLTDGLIPGLGPFTTLLFAVAVVWLFLIGIALIAPPAGVLLIVVGAAGVFIGQIWFLALAFQDDASTGLLCLFVPFYAGFFLLNNLDTAGKPFLVSALGGLMLFSGIYFVAQGG
jgi:predicted Zn finger-like uncharacterized protein